MSNEIKRFFIPVFVLAFSITMTTISVADDPDYPNGVPFQAIEQDFDTVIDAIGSIQADLGDLINELKVEVVVNLTSCANLPVQCMNFGYANPVNGNDSPIQLVASVSRGGVPVTGLVFDDFEYNSGPVAPGGATVLFCTDSHQGDMTCGENFFFEANGGTYNMWLRPFNFQDWDDGLYAGTLSVSDADGNGVALVSFTIN